MVDKVFYQNIDKYPAIVNDYRQVKDGIENFNGSKKQEKDSKLVMALEALPPVRRVASLSDKVENGDLVPALGLASLALINLPEDCRDIKASIEQLKCWYKGEKFVPKYDYKQYQHNFSFFKGTAIEEWLHKHVDAGKKWANWLYENDKTLADTKFGKNLLKITKGKAKDVIETEIKNYKGVKAEAFLYEGSKFGQLTGRAMRRATKLGVIALALIELPKILKAVTEGDGISEKASSTLEQTTKSAINVASTTAGIGYGGAIGAKYFGATGSIVGMGLGAILGSKLSDKVQQFI